ncbi:MAG: hypothetical protein KDD47_00865, partial [Acidobacteria bacterium]|nr:hypothetical protein [Acidobacteriota bacterium]
LIADEPTGNLDPDLSEEILSIFHEINQRGTTLLIATHDRALLERLGKRVLTLQAGRLAGDSASPEVAAPRLEPSELLQGASP